jgi:hypothetical protein
MLKMQSQIGTYLLFLMHQITNDLVIAKLNNLYQMVHNKIFLTMVIIKQNWSRLFDNNIKGTFVE